MPKQHSLQLSSGLRYERAGLLFRVNLDLPEERTDGQGATVRIVAENLATGSRVPFTNAACPALADFMAGYPRWMVRLGIRATKGDDEVAGTVRANASVEDLLSAAAQLGDMIDQKFALYKESVLV